MNLFQKLGLIPTETYQQRLARFPAIKKYDLPKRLIVWISVLLALLGLVLIGVSCAFSPIHPMIGCGIFIGSLITFMIGASLPSLRA